MTRKREEIASLLESESERSDVFIQGWVRTRRDSKNFFFLELNDGSCLKNIQVVVTEDTPGYEELKVVRTGASVSVRGSRSLAGERAKMGSGSKGSFAYRRLLRDLPTQKKRHSMEFLREIST